MATQKKKYEVLVKEVHVQPYYVEATTKDEARKIVEQGGGDIIEGGFEYSHTLPSDDWRIEDFKGVTGMEHLQEPVNWVVRVYNEENETIDTWTIQNRTENEATKEAEADVSKNPEADTWTLTELLDKS